MGEVLELTAAAKQSRTVDEHSSRSWELYTTTVKIESKAFKSC